MHFVNNTWHFFINSFKFLLQCWRTCIFLFIRQSLSVIPCLAIALTVECLCVESYLCDQGHNRCLKTPRSSEYRCSLFIRQPWEIIKFGLVNNLQVKHTIYKSFELLAREEGKSLALKMTLIFPEQALLALYGFLWCSMKLVKWCN